MCREGEESTPITTSGDGITGAVVEKLPARGILPHTGTGQFNEFLNFVPKLYINGENDRKIKGQAPPLRKQETVNLTLQVVPVEACLLRRGFPFQLVEQLLCLFQLLLEFFHVLGGIGLCPLFYL